MVKKIAKSYGNRKKFPEEYINIGLIHSMNKIPLVYKIITMAGFGFLLFFILSGDNSLFFNKNRHNLNVDPKFELQSIYIGQRFPNISVALDGTVVATWGRESVLAKLSKDGGATWGPEIIVANAGIHGGGLVVDRASGDMLIFVQDKHPPADIYMYRSKDNGETWKKEKPTIQKDLNNNKPEMHMAEHGIYLKYGALRGRLIRSSRVYGKEKGYNLAIYSDDHGKSWNSSNPFPLAGTGEGAIVELNDGRLYFTSRKHWFKNTTDYTHNRTYAWSYDGGETWVEPEYSNVLPDGPRYRGNEGRGSNFQGHFGMMAGLTRLPLEGDDVLLYSNADSSSHERKRMTVWASFDGGQTWPVKRLVYEGWSAYSSLASGRLGTTSEGWIYLQFEGGEKKGYEKSYFARFNLSWIINGVLTGDGEMPEWIKEIKRSTTKL